MDYAEEIKKYSCSNFTHEHLWCYCLSNLVKLKGQFNIYIYIYVYITYIYIYIYYIYIYIYIWNEKKI